jgi:putative transposase
MIDPYPGMDCCRALDVSRSGFYAWQRRAPSERDQAHAEWIVEIQSLLVPYLTGSGRPRLTRELRRRGRTRGKNRVARLMRQKGRRGVPRRCYRPQTPDRQHD